MKAEYMISFVYLVSMIVFFIFGLAMAPVLRSDIDFVDKSTDSYVHE